MKVVIVPLLVLLLVPTAEAVPPRWRVHLGATPCRGHGLISPDGEVADIKLLCRGRGKPFLRGSIRLVCSDNLLLFFGVRVTSRKNDCTAFGSSYLDGQLCDDFFNAQMPASQFDCDFGTARDVTIERVR